MTSGARTVHIPVLFEEVMDALRIEEGGRFLDCTVGGGGHSEGILQSAGDTELVGLDRDRAAITRAKERLASFSERVTLYHRSFAEIGELLGELIGEPAEEGKFKGVLADFGLSSDQLESERGFSFHEEGSLDMRMDTEAELTAAEIVNRYPVKDLMKVLSRGGVRKHVKRYASVISQNRPVQTSKQLAQIISEATPMKDRKDTHPATVVFQAIRMEVNQEREQIEAFLAALPEIVVPGGRCVCISFHSLEDQIVTKQFRKWEGTTPPANWPGGEALEEQALGKLLTKKAIVPSEEEIQKNPRSRSARMRVFEFIGG